MAYEDSFNDMQVDARKYHLRTWVNKSSEELTTILRRLYVTLDTLNPAEAAIARGQMEACMEILDTRRKKAERFEQEKESIERAKKQWKETLQARREKAIYNLPAAVSYNGQLVAAILEEQTGLAAPEIRRWADELMAMDDAKYADLLKKLVSEKIIRVDKNGKYGLLTLCTDDLFPPDLFAWAYSECVRKGISPNTNLTTFLMELANERMPESEADWIANPIMSMFGSSPDRHSVVYALEPLVKNGILVKQPVPNTEYNLYYFPMLGEEGAV